MARHLSPAVRPLTTSQETDALRTGSRKFTPPQIMGLPPLIGPAPSQLGIENLPETGLIATRGNDRLPRTFVRRAVSAAHGASRLLDHEVDWADGEAPTGRTGVMDRCNHFRFDV